MPFLTDDISINTLIGTGSSVSGDIRINGFLRVDGDIDGNLEASNNVIVGEKARIHGDITASSVVIGGVVIGDILAPESITLLSTATVIGNVTTHRLQVEEKVVLHGHCISLKKEEDYDMAVKNAVTIHTPQPKV